MPTIGLVLSGGGARAIAHLGVLQGLDELGIKPNVISGVSAGAIIGALYAAGYSPKQILDLIKEHSSASLAKMVLFSGGLFTAPGLKLILKSTISKDKFESLNLKLFVTATDICSGTAVTFSKGPLYDVLIGSSSIPLIFAPKKHGKLYLVDGGVLNNLPVKCIRDKCDIIIGANVNKVDNQFKQLDRLNVLDRCFHLAISDQVTLNAALCDIFIEAPLRNYNMFDLKHADKIFKTGYRALMEKQAQVVSLCLSK
ncbi:patatin-like phospholipase family protein [Mucilaginibacter puniceus]